MDKNQIIGLVLIGIILIGYIIFSQPSKEELEVAKRKRDSIARVHDSLEKIRIKEEEQKKKNVTLKDSIKNIKDSIINVNDTLTSDSLKIENLKASYGAFAHNALGEEKFLTLENEKMIVKFTTKGARIYSVELKNYKTHDSLPLLLFDGEKNVFGLDLFTNNKPVSTNELYFSQMQKDTAIFAKSGPQSMIFRLNAGKNKYVEFAYTIEPESFKLDFDITFNNVNDIINQNTNFIDLNWNQYVPFLERGNKWENQNTTLYYKHFQDEVENLSETSDEDLEKISTSVRWIAYKQQFFSSILIAEDEFSNAIVQHKNFEGKDGVLKYMSSRIGIEYKGEKDEIIPMAFYFGPNQYKILGDVTIAEDVDLKLQELIPLGWGIFGWINKIAIIQLFNFLGSFINSYGLIILLMTVIIKLVIFPLTYKSYMSSAKMRVLKPQVEELNKKYSKDKAMEKQQAVMALYKKAGVNPMGGCIPIALQFPILIAMFRFFPASIELRQQSFLWAEDLSSYDSILDLPFEIPWYGDHVSLFTLLMAAAIVVSTRLNSSQMDAGNQQLPGMKTMMYLMPVMMVFWFNNYSAGLSYYYFLSNIITIIQTYLIRRSVNEEDILKKLNANVKKNKNKKKSGFQKRLEDMAKKQGYNMPKKK